jgi:hypothetical protein
MGLKAKTPDRMGQAVGNGSLGVQILIRTVHGLQEKVSEIEIFEHRWVHTNLRENDLQLVAAPQDH